MEPVIANGSAAENAEDKQTETSAGNLFIDIHVDNEAIRAAVCRRCSAKIYPAGLLAAHIEHHRMRDLFLQEEMKKLQATMERMR